MSLEQDLRHALRRESPPAGFSSRVLQRIDRERHPKPRRWWRAVAASLTLTALLGGWGARAREQVLLALKIAGEKVRYAQQEVRDIGSNE
jgi:hypothetical protein